MTEAILNSATAIRQAGKADPLQLATVHQIRDTCLCLATQRAARVLARRFDHLFLPLGITNGQFSMMVALTGTWTPRMGELAEFLAMDQATLTAAMKTLERQGLVAVSCDEKDRRARRPALTDAGRSVVARAVPLWRDEHDKVQALIPDIRAVDLSRAMGRLGQRSD